MLKKIWKSNVFKFDIEKESSLTLGSDKYICEVINETRADVKLLKSVYEMRT